MKQNKVSLKENFPPPKKIKVIKAPKPRVPRKLTVMTSPGTDQSEEDNYRIMFTKADLISNEKKKLQFSTGPWTSDSMNEFSPSPNNVTKILSSLSYGRNNLDSESERSCSPEHTHDIFSISGPRAPNKSLEDDESALALTDLALAKDCGPLASTNMINVEAPAAKYPIVITIDDDYLKKHLPDILKEDSINEVGTISLILELIH
jgi:hypothetical protein